ncbi:BQ2448_2247 [Microbotryum intermedium]|uniref:BQ2448_2247 protein n=1 Tax=Microbotryum intermedium TaxID=269621 RepID=A0A238F7V1_9BASI|nr:BQ2448_2247 [Microbotryum intermedium]
MFLSEASPKTFQMFRAGGVESEDVFWTESNLSVSTEDDVRTVVWKSSRLQALESSRGMLGV